MRKLKRKWNCTLFAGRKPGVDLGKDDRKFDTQKLSLVFLKSESWLQNFSRQGAV